ncbi:MAG: hypothetical protein EOP07_18655 [Proteobacteria bacterium]|nr:MAG: hypothetical protein EOP07_18655 [Pseudomonadota bacterium]
MLVEAQPIEIFVSQRFNDKALLAIIEDWRMESEILEKIIVAYFKEMGIFSVPQSLETQMRQTILVLLQNSPEIFTRVRKAQAAEALRRQSRRADNGK